MSATKKLSEIISAIWSDDEAMGTGVTKSEYRAMYDAARALEERVAEMEWKLAMATSDNRTWDCYMGASDERDAATARAEAAERERKEFQLETQRKEVECNQLASKLNKVRAKCEAFYCSISESHDATALADAVIMALDDEG